ncbi:PREDICTED: tetraspanin-4-like [Apaloderma vittatum]|uniref:tetraspanin-4-like n=1 Tax=Apaloderma vittatum TaxID=57397 RepID=UPI0005217188|nr:PREDICTED: tetraspanin-4-like [Apaloderma vittatum]
MANLCVKPKAAYVIITVEAQRLLFQIHKEVLAWKGTGDAEGYLVAIKDIELKGNAIDKYAQRDLKKGLHLYGTEGNIGLTNAWSIIQTDFRCCGVSNYTDWFEVYNTTRVPDSCCLEFSENCGLHSPGTWWKAPCYETVKIWLQENLLAVGIFGLCTAMVQILGLTFAMTMYCQVVKADTYCA